LVLGALACGGDDVATDAGPAMDGGETDGGPVADAGDVDAGPMADGGEMDGGAVDTDAGVSPTWDDGIGELFATACTGCHPWANTYDGVVAKILDGSMRIRVEAGHRMTSDQAELLLAWIDDGYPES
jgi:hypothetical protein